MWRVLVAIFLLGVSASTDHRRHPQQDRVAKVLAWHYERSPAKEPSYLARLDDPGFKFPKLFTKDAPRYEPLTLCSLCEEVGENLIETRRNGTSREEIAEVITDLCVVFNIQAEDVCRGAVQLNIDIFLHIIDKKKDLKADRVCAVLLQGQGCTSSTLLDWKVNIPAGLSVAPPTKPPASKNLKILHLTDVHYDPLYKAGGNAKCDRPLCCQSDQGKPSKPEDACGFWSDYRNADSPWNMLADAFEHIKRNHSDVDFIYFTGDIISHRVWGTSLEQNRKDITLIYNELRQRFSTKKIYPVLGNHEPHPLNVFVPGNAPASSQWMFDLVSDLWQHWLPKDTQTTIRRGGYYTTLIRDGYRVVALNSNVCYIFNWWLINDDVDPFGQLQWLSDVLRDAEKKGERVHILSHIPNGQSDCLRSWSRNFRKIVERFSKIVVAQFNGHTHYDEFTIFFNSTGAKEPINVAFNGGSLTSFTQLNPNYRVYDVDAGSFEVLDHHTWTFNVTAANLKPNSPPQWYELYSFKKDHAVKDLKAKTLYELVRKFTKDNSSVQKYYKYYVRDAAPLMKNGCDVDCVRNKTCDIVTAEALDDSHCKDLFP